MDELWHEWGKRVRQRRTALGLTQVDIAERTRCRQATISRIERGASSPSDATKYRLAAALLTTVQDLFPYVTVSPQALADPIEHEERAS